MEMEFFVPPDDADALARVLDRGAPRLVPAARPAPKRTCGCASTARRSARTTRSATSDIEYLYPIGWSELEGVANRGDYDLRQHTEASGTKLEYVDPDGARYMPFVIEPAVSIDRIMLALLVDAYDEEVVEDRQRTLLRLHPAVAPVKAAVLPLISKEEAGMVEPARKLYEELRRQHLVEYDDGGNIGRRYRRQDEIGTPWAFTIDDVTLEDGTVTVRDRDSLAQERLPLEGVRAWLDDALERPWSPPPQD